MSTQSFLRFVGGNHSAFDARSASRWLQRYFQNVPVHPAMHGREYWEELGSAYCDAASAAPKVLLRLIKKQGGPKGLDHGALAAADSAEAWQLLEHAVGSTTKGFDLWLACAALRSRRESLLPHFERILGQRDTVLTALELAMEFPNVSMIGPIHRALDHPKCGVGTNSLAWDAIQFIQKSSGLPIERPAHNRTETYRLTPDDEVLPCANSAAAVSVGERTEPGDKIIVATDSTGNELWSYSCHGYGLVTKVTAKADSIVVEIERGFAPV